jgi:hypothetical protein
MNDIERLLIADACRDLICRYAYLNDEREFDALADLFTSEAVFCRPSAPETPIIGRDAILKSFKARPADVATFHVCSDFLIDVRDAEHASARSRILLLSGVRPAAGVIPDPPSVKPPLPGTFRDEMVLTAHGWKFQKRVGSLWVRT